MGVGAIRQRRPALRHMNALWPAAPQRLQHPQSPSYAHSWRPCRAPPPPTASWTRRGRSGGRCAAAAAAAAAAPPPRRPPPHPARAADAGAHGGGRQRGHPRHLPRGEWRRVARPPRQGVGAAVRRPRRRWWGRPADAPRARRRRAHAQGGRCARAPRSCTRRCRRGRRGPRRADNRPPLLLAARAAAWGGADPHVAAGLGRSRRPRVRRGPHPRDPPSPPSPPPLPKPGRTWLCHCARVSAPSLRPPACRQCRGAAARGGCHSSPDVHPLALRSAPFSIGRRWGGSLVAAVGSRGCERTLPAALASPGACTSSGWLGCLPDHRQSGPRGRNGDGRRRRHRRHRHQRRRRRGHMGSSTRGLDGHRQACDQQEV